MTNKMALRAPGSPGIEPRWTHGAKLAVGTAYSAFSRVWYTLDAGCITEVYYPTIDTPQIRDLHDETNYFSAELNLVQAQLNERFALVQLYESLGGGWQK